MVNPSYSISVSSLRTFKMPAMSWHERKRIALDISAWPRAVRLTAVNGRRWRNKKSAKGSELDTRSSVRCEKSTIKWTILSTFGNCLNITRTRFKRLVKHWTKLSGSLLWHFSSCLKHREWEAQVLCACSKIEPISARRDMNEGRNVETNKMAGKVCSFDSLIFLEI